MVHLHCTQISNIQHMNIEQFFLNKGMFLSGWDFEADFIKTKNKKSEKSRIFCYFFFYKKNNNQ